MGDLVERMNEEGLGFGIGPALLCQEAADEITRLRAALADAHAVGFAAGVEAAAKAADAEVSLLYKQIKDNNEFYRKNGIWDTGANTECEYRIRALKAVAEATRALTPPDATAAAARVLLGVWPNDASFDAAFNACAASYHGGDQMQDVMDRTLATVSAALRAIAGDTP